MLRYSALHHYNKYMTQATYEEEVYLAPSLGGSEFKIRQTP